MICPNIGIVYSGMGPDFRVLVTRARKSAQAYWKVYGEYPPTKVLTQEIANIMQQATHSGCVTFGTLRLCADVSLTILTCTAFQRCSPVRCIIVGRGLGQSSRANTISGRSIRLILGVEG